jgi:hypothetical protein
MKKSIELAVDIAHVVSHAGRELGDGPPENSMR